MDGMVAELDVQSGLTELSPGSGSMRINVAGAGSTDTETAGVRSLGVPVAGVRVWGGKSPFDGVMAGLGCARSSCEDGGVDCMGWMAVGLQGAVASAAASPGLGLTGLGLGSRSTGTVRSGSTVTGSAGAGSVSMGLTGSGSMGTAPVRAVRTGSTVTGLVGAGSVGTGLAGVETELAGAVRTGLMGETGAGSTGSGSAGTAFANAVQTGSMGTSPGVRLTGMGLCCGVLSTTGLRLMASLTSAAQSDRAGSRGLALAAARAVGDGAGSCTSPWVVPVSPYSPVYTSRRAGSHLFISSCCSTPLPLSSLSTARISLYCCSVVVMASFGSMAVAVVVVVVVCLTSDRAGMGFVAVMCCTSATRSCGCGVVVVS